MVFLLSSAPLASRRTEMVKSDQTPGTKTQPERGPEGGVLKGTPGPTAVRCGAGVCSSLGALAPVKRPVWLGLPRLLGAWHGGNAMGARWARTHSPASPRTSWAAPHVTSSLGHAVSLPVRRAGVVARLGTGSPSGAARARVSPGSPCLRRAFSGVEPASPQEHWPGHLRVMCGLLTWPLLFGLFSHKPPLEQRHGPVLSLGVVTCSARRGALLVHLPGEGCVCWTPGLASLPAPALVLLKVLSNVAGSLGKCLLQGRAPGTSASPGLCRWQGRAMKGIPPRPLWWPPDTWLPPPQLGSLGDRQAP